MSAKGKYILKLNIHSYIQVWKYFSVYLQICENLTLTLVGDFFVEQNLHFWNFFMDIDFLVRF